MADKDNKIKAKCDFCGKVIPTSAKSKKDVLFLGGAESSISICGSCIEDANRILQGTKLKDSNDSKDILINQKDVTITPKLLKDKLDEWIIDQDLAKKKISIAVYDHYKRINLPEDEINSIEKSNILLAGSTGCGKTAIVKALAKELDLPLHIEDVTTITTTGYQGRNVEDMLSRLLAEANGDLDKAQHGIILLDEGDKLRKVSGNGGRDVKGEGVQQSLLKIVEGGIFTIKYKNAEYSFDTTNVLFILAGAFDGIEKIISKRLNSAKTAGGFTGIITDKTNIEYNKMIIEIHPDDLKAYGMMSELLGRFPIIVPLQELSEEALVRILTEPKNAIIKQMVKSFALDNIKLKFDKEALIKIARKAKERKTGARALRSIVEEVITDAKYDCPGTNITEVEINNDLSLSYIEN